MRNPTSNFRSNPPRVVVRSLTAFALAVTAMGVIACADEGEVEPDAPPEPETGPCECGVFDIVGNMNVDRYSHTALVLDNGEVLIGGGNDGDGSLTDVEIYSTATGTSRVMAPLPDTPRFGLDLHQLGSNQVLAIYSGSDAAVLDIGANTWSTLPSARLGHNRAATIFTTTGLYLVGGASFPFMDRLDVDAGTWEELPNLLYGRESHTATELEDGRILIAGGYDSTQFINQGATELYDPVTGESTDMGTLEIPRQDHTAVRLDDGRVMITGGFGPDIGVATAVTEIFDPQTETWERVGDLPNARVAHTLTVLDDGQVIVVGGIDPNLTGPYSDAAVFNPRSGEWRPFTERLVRPRQGHAAVASGDGVLIFGGNESNFVDFASTNDEVERLSVE